MTKRDVSFHDIDSEVYAQFKTLCTQQRVTIKDKFEQLMRAEIKARERAKRHGL